MTRHNTLLSLLALSFVAFSAPVAYAEVRTEIRVSPNSSQFTRELEKYKVAMKRVRLAEDRQAMAELLDELSPRFWNGLSRTGQSEVLDVVYGGLVSNDPDEGSYPGGETLLERALRFASLNDAIYHNASLEEIVDILNPRLEKALGYGRDAGRNLLREIAHELKSNGTGESGVYTSFEEFNKIYHKVIQDNYSGR